MWEQQTIHSTLILKMDELNPKTTSELIAALADGELDLAGHPEWAERLANEPGAMQQLAQSQLDYLTKLEGFTAARATGDLSEGELDAAQLREASEFIFEQRAESTREMLALRSASAA